MSLLAVTHADASDRFADLHDRGGGNRLYGLLVMRPPLERRIRGLRDRAEDRRGI